MDQTINLMLTAHRACSSHASAGRSGGTATGTEFHVVATIRLKSTTACETLRRLAVGDGSPCSHIADDVIVLKPDGVWLSNGPGDPEPLTGVVANIRKLIGRYPIFGICLGHQLMGLAVGGRTYKLPFGHHGGNQPVKDLTTGRVKSPRRTTASRWTPTPALRL
jgi:carbamoyl-phosphate synthase small subunit